MTRKKKNAHRTLLAKLSNRPILGPAEESKSPDLIIFPSLNVVVMNFPHDLKPSDR